MLKLLLFASILVKIVDCSCPSGFELIRKGQCIGNYTRVNTYYDQATAKAISLCAEVQGQPIIIHDETDQAYWSSRVNVNGWTIMGLVCNLSKQKWEWADGSMLDYKPKSYNSALNQSCTTAGMAWAIEHSGVWNPQYSVPTHTAYTTDIFCTYQLPSASDGKCERFGNDEEDGVCYQVGDLAESWQDAQLNCKKVGGNLASIHNSNENAFIRRMAVSNGSVHGIFIGGTVTGKGGDFGWIDGTAWDYENYYPGFPRTGFGDCLGMDTSTTAGQWKNMECTALLPVACIRDQTHLVNRNITCSAETYVEEAIITSPGFPFDASVPCEFYLMVDAGKRVELEIILLEANSCCDFLTIYDGYFGGYVLANVTGSIHNATYTTANSHIMEVHWNPTGGVNVKGAVMTFRGV